MIDAFCDEEILNSIVIVKVIDDRGQMEKGEGRGVFRDILTGFWQEFFVSATVGANEKIPAIRHDYQSEQWKAIARVFVYGFSQERYLPIQLSPAFISVCLFGESCITKAFLLESFKAFLSVSEQEIVNEVVSGNMSPLDDDVMEFLSSYQCFTTPSGNNIENIIWQLAHKEIIQKPRYIANCWTPILSLLKRYMPFQSLENLVSLYNEKKPNAKKVVKLLDAHPNTDAERACLDHLKRFIRSIEGNIGTFLQFTTGSNVLVCDKISISFNKLEGLGRRPVAHTCTPTLEIPSTYQSYNELSEDFSNLLSNKNAWAFDIV